ncbi:alkaline phosphatase [Halosquirtibacter xylanolyticus]|uniref:alkaline phosphatase n=1 Tax=Halosquirtibacter xylanolyticus TaxID=3374599 RepID=UPI003747F4D4|nr:alkaline phosphatase [Prolixibacteraceae bacterium]
MQLLSMDVFSQTRRSHVYTSDNGYELVDVLPSKKNKVKNVILMIGDGMGLTHSSSAWVANRGKLNMVDRTMHVGLTKTYCEDQLITDSGAAGTAIATGVKAKYHSVGVDVGNKPMDSLTDLAKAKGLSTGIVVTCGLTDATPACFVSNNKERENEEEIALGYLDSNLDVVFGGGRRQFNRRSDKRDLLKELDQKGYHVVSSLEEAKIYQGERLFAVVEEGQIPLAMERKDEFQDAVNMAITHLDRNKRGFFAMFESSRIDDCGHANNVGDLIEEIFDFDQAVGQVLKWAELDGETLVIIVADHETGGLTLNGGDLSKGEVDVDFQNGGHSGVMVPIYTYGPMSDSFSGVMENTDIFVNIVRILKL